ncbi:hypothetical protein LTR86_002573 [Recurvomyces mirabilis]|nr:hypothetical protein LTR86_002573 [Recurvomyces mirabilis]
MPLLACNGVDRPGHSKANEESLIRKVRCNGEPRCQQCSHLDLKCIYAIRQKRKTTLDRGKHVRDWANRQDGELVRQRPLLSTEDANFTSSPSSTTGGAHTDQFFRGFLQNYELYVYPFHPIISTAEVSLAIDQMQNSREACAFVYSMVCVTLTHSALDAFASDILSQCRYWVFEAIKLQDPILSVAEMTVRRVLTVEFFHVCLMGLGEHDLGHFYLRQAAAMVQSLKIWLPRPSDVLIPFELARRQRLYCLLFVHERFHALAHQHELNFPALPGFPPTDSSIPAGVDHGFRQIVALFDHIDSDLIAIHSNKSVSHVTDMAAWIESTSRAIQQEHVGELNDDALLSDVQLADIIITKHWLHMLVWQIAVSQCLLSSQAAYDMSMSLLLPVRVSSELRKILAIVSKRTVLVHGTSMQMKLFEITDTIASVVATVPGTSEEDTRGWLEDFVFLLSYLYSLPGMHERQASVLRDKLERLRDMFPQHAAMLSELEQTQTSPFSIASI